MRGIFVALSLLLLGACSPADPTTAKAPAFVNIVWRTDGSSSVPPGMLYVFLSEGTLLITRAGDKPMTGTWKRNGSELIMVEQDLSYRVEILKLTADAFRIRSHNPGEPVDIALVRAE